VVSFCALMRAGVAAAPFLAGVVVVEKDEGETWTDETRPSDHSSSSSAAQLLVDVDDVTVRQCARHASPHA